MTGAPTRSQTAVFGKRVRDFMRPAPLIVGADQPAAKVVADMAASASASALIVDGDGRLDAILTERDVARRIAYQAPPNQPIGFYATRPVLSVTPESRLFRAVARMRRHDLRHMPVVDVAGRPLGMIDLQAAVAVAADQMLRQIDRLSADGSLAGLKEVKQVQAEIAAELLADNLPAPDIQALITDINHDIHRRVLELARGQLDDSGWGKPPVEVTLLVMGSGGRGENFLSPDQDNGFILADYADDEHKRIDPYFIALAERFTRQLDEVGFALCKGDVMATNPLWRKTASQWRRQIALWVERRSPVAILFADIFFDFVAVDGPSEPAESLRRFVSETLAGAPALLGAMSQVETRAKVALGLFGRIVTAGSGEHAGLVDLKLHGTMPLVAAVRLWALKAGVSGTATLARIASLRERAILGRDEADGLADAFNHVTWLLLRQQLADYLAGRTVGNFVDPKAATRRERDHLVVALRAIDLFSKRVRAELTGQML